ncbi:MAG TPA: hypothetical protein VF746_27350 [Longimicrobium sp.]|jgi:hypothetical protein
MSRATRAAALALALAASLPLAARPAAAQEEVQPPLARNAVYVELLGSGLLYSINYDRLITPSVAGRVGFMFVRAEDDSGDSGTIAIAPITASKLWGNGSSHFETGVGLAVATADFDFGELDDFDEDADLSSTTVYGTGVLGYRYQRPGGGFLFRVGLTPIFTTNDFAPWFGLSFGYAF